MPRTFKRLQIEIEASDEERAHEFAKQIEDFARGLPTEHMEGESISVLDTTVPREMVKDNDYI